MVFNAVIGIVQETRAKRTLDRLQILIAPMVVVVATVQTSRCRPSDVVVDDLVRLRPGDQVPVDGTMLESAALEVDESALTGEADPIVKRVGDEVRSGSAVMSGSALVVATQVGDDAWIHRLIAQAKEFVLTSSELRSGRRRDPPDRRLSARPARRTAVLEPAARRPLDQRRIGRGGRGRRGTGSAGAGAARQHGAGRRDHPAGTQPRRRAGAVRTRRVGASRRAVRRQDRHADHRHFELDQIVELETPSGARSARTVRHRTRRSTARRSPLAAARGAGALAAA